MWRQSWPFCSQPCLGLVIPSAREKQTKDSLQLRESRISGLTSQPTHFSDTIPAVAALVLQNVSGYQPMNLLWTVLMIWLNVHYIRKSKRPGMTALAALGGMVGIVAAIVVLGLLLGWPPGAMGTMSGILMFLGGAAAAQYHASRTNNKILAAPIKTLPRQQELSQPSLCSKCGHSNASNARFCSECGESFEKTTATNG